jgi:hypothetical protein
MIVPRSSKKIHIHPMVDIYFAKPKKKKKSLTVGDLKRSPTVAFA